MSQVIFMLEFRHDQWHEGEMEHTIYLFFDEEIARQAFDEVKEKMPKTISDSEDMVLALNRYYGGPETAGKFVKIGDPINLFELKGAYTLEWERKQKEQEEWEKLSRREQRRRNRARREQEKTERAQAQVEVQTA